MFITNDDKIILRKFINSLKPFKKCFFLILFFVLLSSVTYSIIPYISKLLMDKGLITGDFKKSLGYILLMVTIMFVSQALGFMVTRYYAYLNSMVFFTFSKKVFKHLLRIRTSYFKDKNLAEIIRNIDMDIDNMSRIVDKNVFDILTLSFRFFAGIAGLLILEWRLTLIVLLIVPVRFYMTKYLADKRRKLVEKLMKDNAEYSSWYGDTLSGIKEIKLWGIERIKLGEFIKKHRKMISVNIKIAFIEKINDFSETMTVNIFINSIYIIGAYMISKSNLSVGTLMAFISYSAFVTSPVAAMLNLGYIFSGIIPAAKRYFTLMDERVEENTGEKLNITGYKDFQTNIVFEDVSFSYGSSCKTINKLSFEIKSGEKIVIVGANGSGKSTILNLLMRFYEPDEGRILLNGTDIRKYDLRSYRSTISSVYQDLYLFNSTIRNNISMFTGLKMEDITKAAAASGAAGFIDRLADRYKSILGSNGSTISGGERQKLAIARALAKKARILLLDEATSNFDMESEQNISRYINNLERDTTVIMVAHKPHILKYADRVILMANGELKGLGSHKDLVSSNSLYRELMGRWESEEPSYCRQEA